MILIFRMGQGACRYCFCPTWCTLHHWWTFATTCQVHQQNVKWFGSHNWTAQQLWTATLILRDAPRCSQIGWAQCDELSGVPRLLHRCSSIFWELWTEYKSILNNVWLSSKCYKIKLLEYANFRAIGSIGCISKTIPVHLEPGAVLSGSDYYNIYTK
jgi:hypothetical protein